MKWTGNCPVEGCGKPQKKKGFCDKHYRRWKAHGDPLGGGTPPGEPLKYLQNVVLPYRGDDCLMWPYARNSNGYGNISIERSWHRVSRLACEEEHGPPPTIKHEAAHSCGNGHLGCVTRKHLSWKTSLENKADALAHGTVARGKRLPQTKLTETEVRAIRKLRGEPQKKVALKFGVSQSRVSMIQNRVDWAWLD